MAEIKLNKRYKYAGDIFQKLIGIGFDVETATAFLNEIEDADVVEVVRCEKCKDFEPHGNGKGGICRNKKLKPCLRYSTDFCSYGKRRDT